MRAGIDGQKSRIGAPVAASIARCVWEDSNLRPADKKTRGDLWIHAPFAVSLRARLLASRHFYDSIHEPHRSPPPLFRKRSEDGPHGLQIGRSAHVHEDGCAIRSTQMSAPGSDLRTWFDEEELEICPFCGARAVPRGDSKVATCLACEVVWIRDAEPHPI